jgi:ATP-dependent DNA helicase RecG
MKISECPYLSKYKSILYNEKLYTTYQLINRFPLSYSYYNETNNVSFDSENINIINITEIKRLSKINNNIYVLYFLGTNNNETLSFKIFTKIPGSIKLNKQYLFKYKFDHKDNVFQIIEVKDKSYLNKIIPIYDIDKITNKTFQSLIYHTILNEFVSIYEKMDLSIINKYNLYDTKTAYMMIHNPVLQSSLEKAILTLKYQEIFQIILKKKNINKVKSKNNFDLDLSIIKNITSKLPYNLNSSQIKALSLLIDRQRDTNMTQSFLIGDVGSGKTIVALLMAYLLSANVQVAIMCPTEILARQHYNTFTNLIKDRVITFISSKSNKEYLSIENGTSNIIIGTHILGSDSITYNNLGYIIIDEQQKFGVNLRKSLTLKSTSYDTLYLSATPIPRSLGLLFFDDYEIIKLDTRKDKQEIDTFYITSDLIDNLFIEIQKEIDNNHNAYVIVPAIDAINFEFNITNTYQKLITKFDKSIIGVIHSKVDKQIIEDELDKFSTQNGRILLSTRMVEIGIDCKNASVIGILGADRFGLSELHQMRGRVGRSNIKSKCYLVSSKSDVIRLNQLVLNNNGFELAELDLLNRGIGDIFGLTQSGIDDLKFLDLSKDIDIINNIKFITNTYDENKINKYKYLLKEIDETVI